MYDYSLIPEHMRHGMKLYLEMGIMPGGFLTAVLHNNLIDAFRYADDVNIEAMRNWAQFIYWEIPSQAWGSPEKVQKWCMERRKEIIEVTQ